MRKQTKKKLVVPQRSRLRKDYEEAVTELTVLRNHIAQIEVQQEALLKQNKELLLKTEELEAVSPSTTTDDEWPLILDEKQNLRAALSALCRVIIDEGEAHAD
jgi:hypothetical protein